MTSGLHKIPDKTIESRKMKTAYEQGLKSANAEEKENALGFVERLRTGYTELDAQRKALKEAKKNSLESQVKIGKACALTSKKRSRPARKQLLKSVMNSSNG